MTYSFQYFGKQAFLSQIMQWVLANTADKRLVSRPTAKQHIHRIGVAFQPAYSRISPKLWHKKQRALANAIQRRRAIQQISKRRKIPMDAAEQVYIQKKEKWQLQTAI